MACGCFAFDVSEGAVAGEATEIEGVGRLRDRPFFLNSSSSLGFGHYMQFPVFVICLYHELFLI